MCRDLLKCWPPRHLLTVVVIADETSQQLRQFLNASSTPISIKVEPMMNSGEQPPPPDQNNNNSNFQGGNGGRKPVQNRRSRTGGQQNVQEPARGRKRVHEDSPMADPGGSCSSSSSRINSNNRPGNRPGRSVDLDLLLAAPLIDDIQFNGSFGFADADQQSVGVVDGQMMPLQDFGGRSEEPNFGAASAGVGSGSNGVGTALSVAGANDSRGVSVAASVTAFGVRNATGQVALCSEGAAGDDSLMTLPPEIRQAVERVNARQRQRVIFAQPDYATQVPPIGNNGMSSISWLLLEWSPDMIMQRVVGLVVAAGHFNTLTNINGFDVRLVFCHNSMEQEMALHGWEECVGRMELITPGQIVEFSRVKVREQGRNPKGSFPYTLLFNGESRARIVGAAALPANNCRGPETTPTPIIVEAPEQSGETEVAARPQPSHQHDMPSGVRQQQPHNAYANTGGYSDDEPEAENGNAYAELRPAPAATDGPSSTGWLSATHPPEPPTVSPPRGSGYRLRRRSPPQRASSVHAQRRLSGMVEHMNVTNAQVAREQRNARDRMRRQRQRQQQRRLLLSPSPPRQQRRAAVITIDSDEDEGVPPVAAAAVASPNNNNNIDYNGAVIGVENQQLLLAGDARFYDEELWPVEDLVDQGVVEGTPNEVMMMGNTPLPDHDREWLCSTSFVLRSLPSNATGVELDGDGTRNAICSICREWLLGILLVIRLPCGHFLHRKCFNSEAKLRSGCPLCRRHFLTGQVIAH